MDTSKTSPMSELSFAKFGPDSAPELSTKDVIESRNSHISSFFKDDLETIRDDGRDRENGVDSVYDSLLAKLSSLINGNGNGRRTSEEDLSSLSGDTISQIYYHSITLIMLYLLYKILYAKNRR
jgi:hypothetical protein